MKGGLVSCFHVSGFPGGQTQVHLEVQQCWIFGVAACVCQMEIPFWRHYLRPLKKYNDGIPVNLMGMRLTHAFDTWNNSCMRLSDPNPACVWQTNTWNGSLRPLCFFLCFRWARALDLGRALPRQKTCVFFCTARALDCCRFSEKTVNFGRQKKHFEKKSLFWEIQNIFPAMSFSACFFRRPHLLFSNRSKVFLLCRPY